MRPPVTIDILFDMWAEDSKVDSTEIGDELLKIPNLHSKYLRIHSHHSLVVKKVMNDYARMKKIRWEYYNGDLNNPEDLETHKLKPFTKKILRTDIPMYLDSDEVLNNLLLKKVLHQEIVDSCAQILKELHSRTFQIKSYIDWEKFRNGS